MGGLAGLSHATPAIQIAGVIDETEARMLVAAGVNYLGFPLRLPHGGEDLDEPAAAKLIASVSGADCVLITYLDDALEIDGFCRALGVTTVQLHGPVSAEALAQLKHLNPGLSIIKSLIVRDDNLGELRATVDATSAHVDAYITDTFDPATGRSGATGKVHDWSLSRALVELSPRPVILAGGLNDTNVAEAIAAVAPAGVDAHTGVEGADGRKDAGKVQRFVARALGAFGRL